MKAKASIEAPHADLTAFGPAVSNCKSRGGESLKAKPRVISSNAGLITELSKVLVIPSKGAVMVSNEGLTLVGNTLNTEMILRIQTTTLWLLR